MAYECTTVCHGNCGDKELGISCFIFCKECMCVNYDNVIGTNISVDDVLEDIDKRNEIYKISKKVENVLINLPLYLMKREAV